MLHLPVNVAGGNLNTSHCRQIGYMYNRRERSYVSTTGAGRGGYIGRTTSRR